MTYISNKPRLYEALGQIVVSFTALERGIDGLLLCSVDISKAQGEIMMSPMTFQQKVTTMHQLIRELHHDQDLGILNQTLEALVDRCLSCEQERNQWVRSYWVPEMDSKAGVVMRLLHLSGAYLSGAHLPDAHRLELVPTNVADLDQFIVVLNATVAYLSGFHQKLFTNFKRIRQLPAGQLFALEVIPNRRY